MKEKEQKKSPIKQRILHFIDYLGISKREFYQTIQVSRGTLESPTGITEEILAKFITTYPEININWLITGSESMFKNEEKSSQETVEVRTPKDVTLLEEKLLEIINLKEKEINKMYKEVGRLENEIEHLKQVNNVGREIAGDAAVADVG